MKFTKYMFKAMTPVMALFQKQHQLSFKQSYDNLRPSREESAASTGTAQSERCLHRKQSAVCASHNVPSDSSLANMRDLIVKGQYLVCLDTDQVADQLLMMFACSWTGNQKPLDI